MTGATLEELAMQGHDFLICGNIHLPLDDDSLVLVITNSVCQSQFLQIDLYKKAVRSQGPRS